MYSRVKLEAAFESGSREGAGVLQLVDFDAPRDCFESVLQVEPNVFVFSFMCLSVTFPDFAIGHM
ncbi:hypothetical protein Phum_PHUM389380 [Pediculus humanus corporis]|uniref:Uncharacterized protein n=1 Tax=Pediculus humanus subsp. corporis TaxID=121224 RepID=E0VQY7_PEDHC|nr:uncharacterized protein Phum_PHUM389380 [Pediculus humanus corporis]EEB15793.1 hypothetical protein Phum_PHUM389380 [Pediculus humanus corporis]